MPGFVVRDIGGHGTAVPATARYLYNYSWEVENLFGNNIDSSRQAMIHLRDVSLPTFVVSKEMVLGASLEYKFGKSVSWEDVKVTWYDTVGMLAIVRQWRQSIWTEFGGLNAPATYKKTSIITVVPPDADIVSNIGASDETIRYHLFGSWPSMIRHGDLTYTSSDVKLVEVTITYDWAEENPQVGSGSAGGGILGNGNGNGGLV